jgi:hypothetical protein
MGSHNGQAIPEAIGLAMVDRVIVCICFGGLRVGFSHKFWLKNIVFFKIKSRIGGTHGTCFTNF